MIENVYRSTRAVPPPLYSCPILIKLEFFSTVFRKILIYQIFMKICPVGAELCRAGRRTDRHNEANSRFSLFCERAYNDRLLLYRNCLQ